MDARLPEVLAALASPARVPVRSHMHAHGATAGPSARRSPPALNPRMRGGAVPGQGGATLRTLIVVRVSANGVDARGASGPVNRPTSHSERSMGAAESALPETFAAVRGSTPKASGRMLQTQDVLFPLQPTSSPAKPAVLVRRASSARPHS